MAHFRTFTATKSGRTLEIYQQTIKRLAEYSDDIDNITFDDITKSWLRGFDLFLQRKKNAVNTRSIHLRNIRTVFNDAIDEELTTAYPFRKFKIKTARTAKRALTIEQLRELFGYRTEKKAMQPFFDLFKLSFLLIGINPVDLLNLEAKNLVQGRLEYIRAKTSRIYSVKLEPEALELIEKYHGNARLLVQGEFHEDYRKAANKANTALKSMLSDITMYWARHSWATIAASLDIPKETIAHALGHGEDTVTDIYIDFDRKKVDKANRRVIDWVLYGKK